MGIWTWISQNLVQYSKPEVDHGGLLLGASGSQLSQKYLHMQMKGLDGIQRWLTGIFGCWQQKCKGPASWRDSSSGQMCSPFHELLPPLFFLQNWHVSMFPLVSCSGDPKECEKQNGRGDLLASHVGHGHGGSGPPSVHAPLATISLTPLDARGHQDSSSWDMDMQMHTWLSPDPAWLSPSHKQATLSSPTTSEWCHVLGRSYKARGTPKPHDGVHASWVGH